MPVLAAQTPVEGEPIIPSGTWDSLHVFECVERGRSAKYKLTSTVMLVLKTGTTSKPEIKGLDSELKGGGDVTLSGSMTRQVGVDGGGVPLDDR
jgi:capping protein beta